MSSYPQCTPRNSRALSLRNPQLEWANHSEVVGSIRRISTRPARAGMEGSQDSQTELHASPDPHETGDNMYVRTHSSPVLELKVPQSLMRE